MASVKVWSSWADWKPMALRSKPESRFRVWSITGPWVQKPAFQTSYPR